MFRRSTASRSTAKTAALSYGRIRQLVLIGMGWTIILLGILIAPLPGPGGIPVILLGSVLLLRNSADARRLFVRMKRRYPRLFQHVEKFRRRTPRTTQSQADGKPG